MSDLKAIDGALSAPGASVRVVPVSPRGLNYVAELHVDGGHYCVGPGAPTAILALEALERYLGVVAAEAIHCNRERTGCARSR